MATAKKLGLNVPDDAEVIELAAGFAIPSKCVVTVTYPERARVDLTVELRAGRYEIKELSVQRDPRAAEITGGVLTEPHSTRRRAGDAQADPPDHSDAVGSGRDSADPDPAAEGDRESGAY